MADENAFSADEVYAAMRPHQRGMFNALGTLALGGKALIDGAVSAVTLPGRVWRGETAPNDVEENTNFAGSMMGGGSIVGKPAGSVGIFAGRNAKTADLPALARAKRADQRGASREDVWQENGWFKGPDDKWRFEIDDSGARTRSDTYMAARAASELTPETRSALDSARVSLLRQVKDGTLTKEAADAQWTATQRAMIPRYDDVQALMKRANDMRSEGPRLENAFDHAEAYAAYPTLAKVRANLVSEKLPGSIRGAYDFDPAAPGDLRKGTLLVNRMNPDPRSTALHEMQHAVQMREGFATGGNIDMMERSPAAWRSYEKRYNEARDWLAKIEARVQADPSHENQMNLLYAKNALAGFRGKPTVEDARQAYQRLTGEAESRLVQTRKDMTPEQRRATPPWQQFDVPETDLINNFDLSFR